MCTLTWCLIPKAFHIDVVIFRWIYLLNSFLSLINLFLFIWNSVSIFGYKSIQLSNCCMWNYGKQHNHSLRISPRNWNSLRNSFGAASMNEICAIRECEWSVYADDDDDDDVRTADTPLHLTAPTRYIRLTCAARAGASNSWSLVKRKQNRWFRCGDTILQYTVNNLWFWTCLSDYIHIIWPFFFIYCDGKCYIFILFFRKTAFRSE